MLEPRTIRNLKEDIKRGMRFKYNTRTPSEIAILYDEINKYLIDLYIDIKSFDDTDLTNLQEYNEFLYLKYKENPPFEE